MIRITSKRHNFRRCGVPHPKGAVDYPDEQFSEKELNVLRAEPMLSVETVAEKFTDEELVEAAKQAIADGNVLKDGRPDIRAMSDIVGEPVSAKDRNRVWKIISADDEKD
jgi:Mu-like prophage FluMu N-terminal domain